MIKVTDLKEKFLAQEVIGEQVTVIRVSYKDVLEINSKGKEVATGLGEWKEEVIYGEVTPELVKKFRLQELAERDASAEINEFTFYGVKMWFGDADRSKLSKRFATDEADGKENTKIVYDNTVYTLPVSDAKAMLHQIESYARDCFDQTNLHRQSISELDSVEDLLAYDITAGYPTKLEF